LALSLPILISSTVYFAGRWLGAHRAARRPVIARAPLQPLSPDGTAALNPDQLTIPSPIGARSLSTYRTLAAIRSCLIDLCRIFLIAALALLVLDLVGRIVPIHLPFPIPLLLVGLLFHDWSRLAAPVIAVALEVAEYLGWLAPVNGFFLLRFGDYFVY